MEETEPKNLYTIEEFRFRLEHTIENIKGVLNEWIIDNEYEFEVLRSNSFKGGFTPRQFANITGSLCNEIINLTSMDYCDWAECVASQLYRLIDEEIDRLGTENILENYTDNEIYELIMNIVRENLSSNEDSLIYCLIKM
jgi:hypothetical protein